MADRIKIQLGLEIDTKTQKVNVNPKLIEQAVAQAMKNVNIPAQEIKARLNVKPEISAAQLQKTISSQLKQVNSVIDDETGKFTKAAKTSALKARRELESAFTLLSPDKSDKQFQSRTFKGLLERVKSDGFDINALNKLTDKQSANLNRYLSKVKAQQSRLSQFQNAGNKLRQVGFATGDGTASLLPTSFLSGVGAAAADLGVEAKALGDKLNVGKQQAAADKIDREQQIKSNKAAALKDKQDRATLAEQKKVGAGDQTKRKFERNRSNLEEKSRKDLESDKQSIVRATRSEIQKFLKNEEAEKKADTTAARKSLAKSDKKDKDDKAESVRKQKSKDKETLAEQKKIGAGDQAERKFQRKKSNIETKGRNALENDKQKKIKDTKAEIKAFLKNEDAEKKADTAAARKRLDQNVKDQNAVRARAIRIQKSQATARAAHSKRVLKAHRAALVENTNISKARVKAADAAKAADAKSQKETDRVLKAQNAEKRLASRLEAGQKLVSEGATGGFKNITSTAQGRLAKDALKQRRDELQQTFSDQKTKGLSAADLKNTTQALKQNDRALSSLEKRMASFGSITKQAGALIGQFLRFAVGYQVLYQAAAAVSALVRSLVDLDKELVGIRAISGASASELNEIEGAIKRVAVSTKFTVAQVAQAARLLSQSGVEPKDIREVLAATANFAAATGSSLEQASDLLSTMRNVFKELDALALSDKLTTAINISKLTAADLAPILSISAQIAKSYELTADQYLAAVTTLKNAGLKASTVATGLRQGIIEVFSPDSKTLGALKKRYAEIGEVLTDEAVRTRFAAFKNEANPLVAALNELNRLGFNDAGDRTFQRAFDIRAENAIRALIGNMKELAAAQAKLNFGGSSVLGSEIQLQSLSATVENLGAAISVLADGLTDGAIPSLQAFLAEAVKTVTELNELNDSLKADTGSGLGTTIAAALGVGGLVFAKGKGSVLQRAGTGAAAAAATAFAGPSVTRGADSVGISVSDALQAGVIAHTAVSAVKFILDKTPLGRLARAARTSSRAPVVPAGGITRGRGAPAPLAKAGNIAAVGIFLQSIFSVAASVFTSLKAKGGFLKLAASLLTKINPITAVITGLISVLLFANSFIGSKAKELAKFNQRLQNVQKSGADVDELSKQADDFRFTTLEKGVAGKGTSARAVEDLSDKFEEVDQKVEDFLDAKTQDISDILQELADTGASAGSSSRNALLRKLSERLKGDTAKAILELTGAQGVLSDDQVELSRAVSEIASKYSEASAATEGLRQRMLQQFRAIEELGDQASEGEKAFAKSFRAALKGKGFGLLIKGIAEKPTDLVNAVHAVLLEANTILGVSVEKAKANSKEEFNKTIDQFLKTLNHTTDVLLLDTQLTDLQLAADQLGISSENLFQTLQTSIEEATKGIEKSFGAKVGRVFGLENDQAKPLDALKELVDKQRATAEAQKLVRFDNFEKDQKRIVQQIKDTLDEATASGIEEDLVKRIREQTKSLLETLARGGPFSEEGKLLPGNEAIVDSSTQTGIKNLQTSQKAESSRQTDITTARTEAGAIVARNSRENQIQSELNELGREEIKAKREGLQAENNLFKKKQKLEVQLIDINIENKNEEIAKASADSALTKNLQGLLVEKAALLNESNEIDARQSDEKEEAQLQLNSALKRRALSLELQDIEDRRTGVGALEEDGFERGKIQARSDLTGKPISKRLNVLGREFDQDTDKKSNLESQIAFAKTDDALGEPDRVEKLRALNLELANTETALGNTQVAMDQLNNTPLDEISEAFSFEGLIAGLESANGGLEKMGENIRGQIVGGLSNLGASFTQAARDGENLGDTLKKTFSSILDGIVDLVANLAIQAAVAAIFKAVIGVPAAATGTSDVGGLKTGISNVDKFAGGGIIRGPGTGTSDSVPGLILDKSGNVRKPVLVSDGEAILTAKATNLIGPDFIDSLNAGKVSKFQSGGLIGRSTNAVSNVETPANVTADAMVANNSNQSETTENSLSIVNIVDKNLFEDYINSPEGNRSMINTISTNAETIKQVLR